MTRRSGRGRGRAGAAATAFWLSLLLGARAGAEEEAASLARALYLERTARDYEAAREEYAAVAARAPDAAARAEARLGEARALVALGRVDPEALAALREVVAEPAATPEVREEAKALLRRHEPPPPDPDAAEAAAAAAAARLEEQARADRERRVRAADRLVESAVSHARAGRFEQSRDDLIEALRLHPDDARAVALLEEVGGHLEDRGDVLRQALRFVANSRLADFRRLSAELDGLRDRGKRSLREGKPADAARRFRDAVERIDGADFREDLAERRAEFAMLLRRALDDAKARGIALEDELAVPPEGRPAPPAWRSEFYALLARVFSSRADEGAPLRFHEVTAEPSLDLDAPAVRFSSSGLPAAQGPGTLRRARWVERHVRAAVAPGTWTSSGRLLERSDDTLIVQHLPEVHRAVEEVLRAFPEGAPAPVSVDVVLYAAKPGGAEEAARIVRAKARPSESGHAIVAGDLRLDEQVRELGTSMKVALLGRANLLLGRRRSASVRFREPTSSVPAYRDREGPRLSIPDADATYGLDVEVYAEDLPGLEATAALSVVATVRRPDRPRVLPLAGGPARVPVLLEQSVEADRLVPHAGSLVLLGLGNPFLGTGAAGDPAGGSHPDLFVLVSATPARPDGGPAPAPDVPREEDEPPPRIVPGEKTAREHDLGPLAALEDEAPPEDWPATPASRPVPREGARAAREAFLGGWLRERSGLQASDGFLEVREGRLVATLSAYAHARVQGEVEALRREEEAVFEVSVLSGEVASDRVAAVLRVDGVREVPAPGAASARVYAVSASALAGLDERLSRAADATSPFAARARLAARHTQLVTARALSVRDLVEDFRVERRADGTLRAVPVNGTAEEGLVAAVRPVGLDGGAAMLHVGATLARLERVEPWRPEGAADPGPILDAPRHQVERAAGRLRLAPGEAILLAIPSPGTGGARTVLVRALARRLPS
jgi:tetratricopeptide (TPR) repeat protein